MNRFLDQLAANGLLGSLLEDLRRRFGGFELLDHWQQGEFHHDIVISVPDSELLSGNVLVVAINCNGGIKEVLSFAEVPDRWALWRWRCPENKEFDGELPPVLGRATTEHWFDPCLLLLPDARSELRPDCRRRARGGGWEPISC